MTVIANDSELEAALERALSLFGEGSSDPRQQEMLGHLLEAIEAYQPAAPEPAAKPNPRLTELTRRLDALQAERAAGKPAPAPNGINTGGFIFPG